MLSAHHRIPGFTALAMTGLLWTIAALDASPATAYEKRKVLTVPPAQEIEVLDPHVDPRGQPRVIPHPTPNGLEIEIPPVVVVHRFYYTGDREFQGPLLPGGPSIVVANHPATGERVYLEVQMLPGAPCVTYRRDCIRYDYGAQAIELRFKSGGEANVVLCEGTANRNVPRPQKPGSDRGIRALGASAKDHLCTLGKGLSAPFVRAGNALPVKRTAEDRAARERDAAVQRTQAATERLNGSIPTVR